MTEKKMYYQAKEDCREDVLLSLRQGALLISEVKYLIEFFQETEQYECCQGAMEAYNEYKKELDEYKY
jgi:hypothetical protein